MSDKIDVAIDDDGGYGDEDSQEEGQPHQNTGAASNRLNTNSANQVNAQKQGTDVNKSSAQQ